MSDPTLDYFESYRKKLKELQDVEIENHNIRQAMDENRAKGIKIQHEINSMRKTITVMIEHGVDPVMAKLKTTEDDHVISIWDTLGNEYDVITTIDTMSGSLNSIYTSMGATGAIGSISAASMHGGGTYVPTTNIKTAKLSVPSGPPGYGQP